MSSPPLRIESKPPHELRAAVLALGSDATVDDEAVDAMTVQRRGPLAVLAWRARGRARRYVFLADAAQRRALSLWAGSHV